MKYLIVVFCFMLSCGNVPSSVLDGEPDTEVISTPRFEVDIDKITSQFDFTKLVPLVAHATPDTFSTLVLESKCPVVVDFYAEWCGPCKTMAPYVLDLAKLNPSVRFVKYEVSQDDFSNPDAISNIYGVVYIPTFGFFYLGEDFTEYKLSGAYPEKLQENLDLFLLDIGWR